MVHPTSLCCFGQDRDTCLTPRPMATTAPHKGMPMRVPICCGHCNGLAHLVPGVETAPLERQRPQRLPPRLKQVERGCVGGLEDTCPARMGQGKQQDIGGTMHIEIVQNCLDWLGLLWDPGVDTLQKVDPIGNGASGRGLRKGLARYRTQCKRSPLPRRPSSTS